MGQSRKPDSLFVEARKPDEISSVNFSDSESNKSLLPVQVAPKALNELPQFKQMSQQVVDLQQQVDELRDKLKRSRKRVKVLKTEVAQLQNSITESNSSLLEKICRYWKSVTQSICKP